MAKRGRDRIKLVSSGLRKDGKKTGTFRTTTKNKKTTTDKIRLKCYDAKAYNKETGKNGMHVEFVEGKI